MEIIKGSRMDRPGPKFQPNRMDGLTAGLNRLIPLTYGRSKRKLITEGVRLTNRFLIISFSDQNRILTQQEKNIETVAFGLIAVIKIGKGILKHKKSLVVQGSLLLVILGAALFGRREIADFAWTENKE